MKEAGYNLNELQNPTAVHIAITENHISEEFKEQFISSLIYSIEMASKEQNENGNSGITIYGTSQKVNDPGIIDTVARNYLDLLYC